MNAAATDPRALAQQGVAALNGGNPKRARELFERVVQSLPADHQVWLGLGFACRALKDAPAAVAAVERSLAIDNRNWRALLLKADLLADAGDARGASSFYAAAMKRAPTPESLPPEARAQYDRAGAMREKYLDAYEGYLRENLERHGLSAAETRRFGQSLDILLGRKEIFIQQPRHYYFPELPQIQFYENERFPWLDALEADTDAIRDELLEVMKDEASFAPYIETNSSRPQPDNHGMLNNPSWSSFYLIKNGNLIEENASRCPRTLEAARRAPLCDMKDRSPSVMFSLLKPGARIPPHNGFINVRAICHLGLIVPEKCMFRVGNDVREWREGKAWVFDDTIQHEAWNGSGQTRVILLFDVWRPELTDEERRLVAGMFEAIDSYGGKQQEWEF